MPHLSGLQDEEYCYLTTTGRVSGRPHEIEIWFGLRENAIYLLSGGGDASDWVRNLLANAAVTVRVKDQTFVGRARLVREPEEEALARRMLAAKYQGWREGRPLSQWAQTALPVAVELSGEAGA